MRAFKDKALGAKDSVANASAMKVGKDITLAIATVNVEGLREVGKRSHLVHYTRTREIHALVLQETYVTASDSYEIERCKFLKKKKRIDLLE